MNKHFIKYTDLEVIKIYNEVLNKQRVSFPKYFWSSPYKNRYAILCTKHLIENILKWDKETVKNNIRLSIFIKNKLNGMIFTVYKNSVFDAINEAYPNEFKLHELIVCDKKTYNNF